MNPVKLESNVVSPLEAKWFQTLSSLLRDYKNIDLTGYKQSYVSRRISARMRAIGCKDLKDYVAHVRREPGELDSLVDVFTINVSSFFRNPEVFDAIALIVFEEWKEWSKRIYWAWSCACAHGEEPYSLSLLWHEWQHRTAAPTELKIIASDIDRDALEKAEQAAYDAGALLEMPRRFRGFVNREAAGFRISPVIKRRVQFVQENVLAPSAHPKFDLILCRNFLIFLDRSQQAKMFEALHSSLAESGFLVLGRAESILGDERKGFRAVDASNRIYQKNK